MLTVKEKILTILCSPDVIYSVIEAQVTIFQKNQNNNLVWKIFFFICCLDRNDYSIRFRFKELIDTACSCAKFRFERVFEEYGDYRIHVLLKSAGDFKRLCETRFRGLGKMALICGSDFFTSI